MRCVSDLLLPLRLSVVLANDIICSPGTGVSGLVRAMHYSGDSFRYFVN